MRAAWFAALLVACALAGAQQPAPPRSTNEQAKELATRLGRELNAEGLETILRAGNVDLLTAFARGVGQISLGNAKGPKTLPANIEALMVKYYADPTVGGTLRALCASTGLNYQSRALFDLFYGEWRSRKVRPPAYMMHEAALRTDVPGVEGPLLAWLTAADPPEGQDRRSIIGFIGRRHYAPATAPFIAMLRKGDRDAEAVTLVNALVDIGGPEAIDAAIEYIPVLRQNPPRDNATAWSYLAGRIAGLPASVPIPYKRFRAALPEGTRSYSLAWLRTRKDLDALPDALEYMGEPGGYPGALEVLVATDSPEVWKLARAQVEKLKNEGRLNDGQYRYASRTLDGKLADPQTHFAEKREMERAKQYQDRRGAIERSKSEAKSLRKSDPERYLVAMRAALESEERLLSEFEGLPMVRYAREQMANDHLELGHVARFRLKRTQEAIGEYALAERLGSKLGGLGIADVRQFDLRDKAAAIAQYRKLLPVVRAEPDDSGERGVMRRWMIRWLEAQIAWLETGTVFSGTIAPDDLGGGILMGVAGVMGGNELIDIGPLESLVGQAFDRGAEPAVDRRRVAGTLEALPPSSFVLMRTAWYVGLLPDANAILAYLARQDPAGFASASIFGVVDMAQREAQRGGRGEDLRALAPGLAADPKAPSPLANAKDRFLRERRVHLAP